MTGSKITKLFFDAPAVLKAIDNADRKSLSRIGSFLRTRIRSSMKVRKEASEPGKAPSAHTRKLKDLTYFSFDPVTRSVVVGPVKFRKGTAPRDLEQGGITTIKTHGVMRRVTIEPRPYMGPGLAAEQKAGTIPESFKDSIKR